MPKPRKSTAILEASGAFDKNPQRAENRGVDAVNNQPVRACPEYFNEKERQCYAQILEDAAPGALKKSDSLYVENFARLQALMRSGIELTAALLAQSLAYTDRLGMNPKARPNVQLEKSKAGNAFTTI